MALAGVAAATFLVGGDDGPSHPDAWDPRVDELAAFVEQERELDFDHPVHVDFLTPEEYSAATRTSEADLTDEERADMEELTEVFRSLGLLSGEVDLFEGVNDLMDTGTLAYYDPATERITVRGTEMTIDLQVTLVHELTHALQDQHFDLGRLESFESSGEAAAFRAVVEGDASLVETRYVEQLSVADRDAYEQTYLEQLEDAALDEIPSILMASFGAHYALGEPLVGIVQERDGWDGVDDMLREPPTTEVELFHPTRFLDGFEPVLVEAVEPADGDTAIDEGDFGAITLYLMLAARMDHITAMEATDTWAGDAYLTSRSSSGSVCTEVVLAARDADILSGALDTWVAGAPPESSASVERAGDRLTLRSCDPGSAVTVEPVTDPMDAIAVPATRSFIIYAVVLAGMDAAVGTCVADDVLATVPLELLSDPDPDDDAIAEIQASMGRSMQSCVLDGA